MRIAVASLVVLTLFGCSAKQVSQPVPTITSPGAALIKTAPSTLTITCGPNGTSVSGTIVTTSKTGVKLLVRNTAKKPRLLGYQITPYNGNQSSLGTIKPVSGKKPTTYALIPGHMDLRCGTSANTGLDDPVTLDIVDRDGFYNDVSVEKSLGCTLLNRQTPEIFPERATRKEALTLMAGRLPTPGKYTFKPGPGYASDSTSQHLIFRSSKGWGLATVTTLPNLSYRPAVVAQCLKR